MMAKDDKKAKEEGAADNGALTITQEELDAKIAEAVEKAKVEAKAEATQNIDAQVERALNARQVAAPKPIPDNRALETALVAARRDPVPVQAAIIQGEPMKGMNFPRRVLLTLDDHSRVVFEAGPQHIPERFADHPYVRACGARSIPIPKRLTAEDSE